MAFDAAVRPGLPLTGASSQPGPGISSGPAPASQSGSRIRPATAPQTARPVTPAGGAVASAAGGEGAAARAAALTVDFPGAAAEARIAAAQRVYMMTLRAAGVSPMTSRLTPPL